MPLYDYECCGVRFECFKPLCLIDRLERCEVCGGTARRIITCGHGGSHGDEAAWIRDTNIALSDEYSPAITTRQDLRRREKELGVVCVG